MNHRLLVGIGRWLTLAILLAACAATSTATPPPMLWRTTQSPVFPSEWPPTSATVWTRYTFAYGSSPSGGLADGMYVSRPLTRTEVQRDGGAGQATTLNTVLESTGIQGVLPLDADSSAILGKGSQVQAQCLQLTALPDEAAAAELREYYRTWIKLNGAFAAHIRAEHADFFAWIKRDP